MPSQRRIKVLGLMVLLSLLLIYYIRSGPSQTRTSAFYTKTAAELNARVRTEKEHIGALAQQRVQEAKEKAERGKKAAGAGVQRVHQVLGSARDAAASKMKEAKDVVQGDRALTSAVPGGADEERKDGRTVTVPAEDADSTSKSVAGRKMMKDDGVAKMGNTGLKESKGAEELSEDEREAKEELDRIVKKSPMIIFSKTYCPHSRKAKDILLNHYDISPRPVVVELDEHPLGSQLQDALQRSTGRRTVPNVLINGKSVGGGDDIQRLDEEGQLVDTVRKWGGKWIVGVKKVD